MSSVGLFHSDAEGFSYSYSLVVFHSSIHTLHSDPLDSVFHCLTYAQCSNVDFEAIATGMSVIQCENVERRYLPGDHLIKDC